MPAKPKTQPTGASVKAFLASVEDETRRKDAQAVAKLMQEVTGETPWMCGASIVGFGAYQSNTGEWPLVGLSPRKANLVLYVLTGAPREEALLAKLGKHKTGKSCLYINTLSDVDERVLRALVKHCAAHAAKAHGGDAFLLSHSGAREA